MTIRLHTADGGFVAEKDIPAFDMPPEVVVWGARMFRRAGRNEHFQVYVEVFGYTVPA